MYKRIFGFDFDWTMSVDVENTKVLTSDTSMVSEQDSVEQQEITDTESADGSRKSEASKAGFNQLWFERARMEVVAEDAQNVYELPE